MKGQVAQWGNSAALRLPKSVLEDLKVAPGSEVEMWVEAGELRVRAAPRIVRYRLEDLLAQIDPNNVPEMIDWGPDVGAEIIDDAYSRGEITIEDEAPSKRTKPDKAVTKHRSTP
uniref:Transcriptional regulator/antitoxin, MazE n=1 Tax=Rhodopseudomonas palustris (strain BisA53) TaxID=316055 RepID=Q07PJ9_RHOP5